MASISANGGVVCFAAVVVLTIFAVHAFDPRLMWDAAGKNGDTAPADAGQNCPAKIEAAAYWDNMEPDRA